MTPSSSAPLVQLVGATFGFDHHPLFERLDLNLHTAEVVALCGPNGCGKSTLLRCITGDLHLTRGRLIHRPELHSGTLEQESDLPRPLTSDHQLGEARLRLLRFRPHLLQLAKKIATEDWDAIAEFEEGGGYLAERRGEQWAQRFGVAQALDQPFASLSFGQRRKVDLAALFAAEPDLILLDEPTNYLDLEGLNALEDGLEHHIQSGRCAILISHDRQLLDRVSSRTLHMELCRPQPGQSYASRYVNQLREVRGGYSDLLEHREAEQTADAHRASETRKKIRSLETDLRRKSGWADKKEASKSGAGAAKPYIAKRAKKLMKRAKDMERRVGRKLDELAEQKPFIEKSVALQVPRYEVAHRSVLSASDLTIDWVQHAPVHFSVHSHDRIGIIGANGCGKTTLLNTLLGRRPPASGQVRRNQHVKVGFLTQGLREFFDERPMIEQLLGDLPAEITEGGTKSDELSSDTERETRIRTALGAAGIRRERVFLDPETLSMGERMRAALIRLALAKSEFIVLDEPTTHLDLTSIEVLERLLESSSAGFLMVSHDRQLVERTCRQVFYFSAEGLRRL